MNRALHGTRGSALIITLFFLVILTVVSIAFMTNSRLERSLARTHLERMRASDYARAGIERVVATLNKETTYRYQVPDEFEPTIKYRYYRNYLSKPGALVTPAVSPAADQGVQNKFTTTVALSSGDSTVMSNPRGLSPDQYPPNLNIQTFSNVNDASYLLTDRPDPTTGKPPEMRVRWVYVRQNKNGQPNNPAAWTLETANESNERQTIDPKKPIIGRFAYWTDEESTKVNYNLAWKKSPLTSGSSTSTNLTSTSHPSRVNLMSLTFAPRGSTSTTPFTESLADMLHTWTAVTPKRYFNSFADARQIDPTLSAALNYNKFELTHFSHDPDTTFFGEDRILLTTNPKLVPRNPDGTYARKFLDILREDIADPDPGPTNNIAGGQSGVPSGSTKYPGKVVTNKLDMVMKDLVRYLNVAYWPIANNGVTFRDKFYAGTTITDAKIGQIAANIIDYVRCRESTQPLVSFMRFGFRKSAPFDYTLNYADVGAQSTAYQGISRQLYFTELGMLVDTEPRTMPVGFTTTPAGWPADPSGAVGADGKPLPQKLYRCWLRAEIHLPARYNVPGGVDLVPDKSDAPKNPGWLMNFTIVRDVADNYYHLSLDKTTMVNGKPDQSFRIMASDVVIGGVTGNTVLLPGGYAVVTMEWYRDTPYKASALGNWRAGLSLGTSKASGYISSGTLGMQIVPQATSATYIASDYPNFTLDTMGSVETDDPRCNVAQKDWVQVARNTFGRRNSRWTAGTNGYKAQWGPQQDVDENGLLSDYSLYMPAPKDAASTDPQNGRVTSVGELGYICTGTDASSTTGSVSWRSVRLQPSKAKDPKAELPDWAFMELFSAPNTETLAGGIAKTTYLTNPHGTSVGGKINVNSKIVPFTGVDRDRGLTAAFLGANDPVSSAFNTTTLTQPPPVALTLAQAEAIAKNIVNRKAAAMRGDGSFGKTGYNSTNAGYGIAETYDTAGEICEVEGVADRGEKSEDLVRQVASLLCSRGGVFSIYTVGQAIQQTPNGKLIVTGEQRQQAVVERYISTRGTADNQDDEVHFRTVYMRNLMP